MLLLAVFALTMAAAPAPDEPGLAEAKQLLAAGKYSQARDLLVKLDASSAPTSHLLGVAQYNLRQYAAAAEALRRAVEKETQGSAEYRESVLLIGQSYYLSAKTADAIPWLEKALAEGLRPQEVSYMLGNAYIQSRQPPQAVAAFARMFSVDPDSAAAHLLTARMMVRQEFEEDALAQLSQALEKDPRIAGAHLLMGELAMFRGRLDEAAAGIRREIALNPASDRAWYKLGDVATRQEKWAEAIPHLQRSIWLNPDSSGPYILLGKCYFKLADWTNAEGMLRRAIALDPQNYSAHYQLGQTLLRQGRAEEGRKVLERSRDLQRDRP